MSLDFNKIKKLYRFFNDEAYNLDGFEQSYLWFPISDNKCDIHG